MGDENQGLTIILDREVPHQEVFRLGIQRRAELIQQQDAAGPEQTARDGDTLRLTLAQAGAALPANRIEPLRQLPHEAGRCRVQDFPHTGLVSRRIAQLQIRADGTA